MAITIKDWKVLKGMLVVAYHPKMIALAMWVAVRYSKLVLTSAYRMGDSGVHGQIPCRGIDIRSWHYNDPQVVVDDINVHWRYDPYKRPEMMCAIYHDTGSGKHIHLQVHDNTQYLRDDMPESRPNQIHGFG